LPRFCAVRQTLPRDRVPDVAAGVRAEPREYLLMGGHHRRAGLTGADEHQESGHNDHHDVRDR